jgi:hypothetical protein
MAKSNEIKRLNPKGAETKYVGFEPEWKFQPTEENRVSSLANAFQWYNYHYGKKDAKEMICHYLEHNGRTVDAKTMRGIPDSQIRLTPAWVCRMTLIGLVLNEHEQSIVDDQISQMLKVKQEKKREQSDQGARGCAGGCKGEHGCPYTPPEGPAPRGLVAVPRRLENKAPFHLPTLT